MGGHNIHCWTGSGHGSITYLQAVESSCNPAFINLGQRLGEEKLFSYIRAFGYGRQSGIDYPGESAGLIFEQEQEMCIRDRWRELILKWWIVG